MEKIPIILDTDIGSDIDDTWALGMALNSPELDIKLITTATGDTVYRAKIVAKFLEEVGRSDIPIAIGPKHKLVLKPQKKYVKNYNLENYPGMIHQDAAKAIVDVIKNSEKRIKIVAIGPLENISNALSLAPDIVNRAEFIGMHGSVRVGYGNSPNPSPEYNVVKDIESCRNVFNANWSITITPLDTCGDIILDGEHFKQLEKLDKPTIKIIMDNYKMWAKKLKRCKDLKNGKSSVLFDTVAIYLAFSNDYVNLENLNIAISDKGETIISDKPLNPIKVAISWKNKVEFIKLLVERLMN